jgi:VWFA-related protein
LFLVEDFATDRRLLIAGLHKAVPRFPPLCREYLSDIDTLHQISAYLSRLPGRKNVLWFSGGSTAFLRPDGAVFQDQAPMRAVYDELEQERIAVYPIDARGLTVHDGLQMTGQHGMMEDAAQATGGRAFYNNNGLSQITSHLVDTSGSFYTLTYSPFNFHFNNK